MSGISSRELAPLPSVYLGSLSSIPEWRCQRPASSSKRVDAHTSFTNIQLFSGLSARRHCHSWWLLLSRHSQCALNSCKQCVLMSSILLVHQHQSSTWS